MVLIVSKGWTKWLNKHSTRKFYNDIPEKVKKLCSGPNSATSKFEKLVQNKNLVVMTRSPLGKKCHAILFNSTVGVPVTPYY